MHEPEEEVLETPLSFEVSYDWMRRFWPVAIGAFAGFALAVEIHFRIYHVRPAPAYVVIPAAILGAILGIIVPLPRLWHAIEVTPGALQLRSRKKIATVATSSVSVIAGELGLSFEGGDIVVWKRIRITTTDGHLTLTLTPPLHQAAFNMMLAACPHAIGVSPRGEVTLPQLAFGSPDALQACRRTITREFDRQQRRSLLAASITGGAGVGLVALFVYLVSHRPAGSDERITSKLAIVAVAIIAACIALLVQTLRRGAQKRRVMRSFDQIADRGVSTEPERLLLNEMKPESLPEDFPRRAKRLAVLSAGLFWVPLAGLILGSVAVYRLRRHRGGPYMLAMAATILAAAVTFTAITLLIFAWQLS